MHAVTDPATRQRIRIQWYLLAFVLLSFGALLFFAYRTEADRIVATEGERLRAQTDVLADDLERNLAATNLALEGVIRDHRLGSSAASPPEAVSRRLSALIDAVAGVRFMGFYGPDGTMLASSRKDLIGQNFGQRGYFTAVREKPDPTTLYLAVPFKSVQNELVTTVGRMVAGPGGEFAGVVVATLDPLYFSSMLRPIAYAPDVWAFVVHGDGVQLQNFPSIPGIDGTNLNRPGTLFRRHLDGGKATGVLTGVVFTTQQLRMMALLTVQPARLRMDKALVIGVSRDLGTITEAWRRQAVIYGAIYGVIAAMCCGGLFWAQRRRAHVEALSAERDRIRLEAADRVQLALRGANLGLFEVHLPTGRWTCDETMCALVGLKVEDIGVTPAGWRARMHPQDQAASAAAFQACVEGSAPFYDFSYPIQHIDGHWVWVLARAQAMERDAQGKAIRVMGTTMDITAVKQAEAEVVRVRNELQAVFDSMAEAIFVSDPQGRMVRINPAGQRLLGLFEPGVSMEEGIALVDMLSMDGEVIARDQWPRPRAIRGDFVKDFEAQLRRRDTGQSVFIACDTAPVVGESGQVELILFSIRDVTERQTAVALRQSEARFRTLIEDAPLAIVMLRDGHIVYSNPRYRRLYGYPEDTDLVGVAWSSMLTPESRLELAAQHAVIGADSPIEQSFEAVGLARDGSEVPVHSTTARVELADGPVTLIFAQDIAAQKRAESAMQQARDVAERASRSKAEFLANMSHEIRTPLNVILGLAYMLERARLERDAHDMVQKIRASGRNLLGIINDILDVSKIEAGRMDLEHAPFRLSDVVDHVANSMGIAAGDKQIELIVEPLPPDVGAFIGDALRLQQVLANLASNAIKFTSVGQVVLRVEVLNPLADHVDGGGAQRNRLRFSVHDTGIGIAPDMLSSVFTAFAQADSSTTRRFGGTGLGLTICRQLVTLMGGEIGVNSTLGQGSEFWFTLDLQPVARGGVSSPEMLELDALVADDSIIARDAVVATARGLGWRVSAVDSGEAALAKLQDLAQGELPDVVVLDWKMPGMDGMETARAIRRSARPQACPIVIMATAYSLAELAAQPGADMVDALLSKPVTTSALYNAVIEARRRRAATEDLLPLAADDVSRELGGVRLLVVDDSEINCEVARRILEDHGAEVHLALDGAAALEWLVAHPGAVDVVLMDVQMPVMDGIEATRRLRRIPAFVNLPVVALTAGAFKAQQDAAREAGMTEFVSKPFDVPYTVALIQRLKRDWPQRAAAGQAPGAPPPVPAHSIAPAGPPVAFGASPPEHEGVDLAQGLRTWGKIETYRDYLRRFVAGYGAVGGNLAVHLAAGEYAEAAALAHKMAGVAANMALPEVYRLAVEMERTLREERDATEALARLDAALQQACDTINRLAPPAGA